MNNEKCHVFFRRVSTAGQHLVMQSSAEAPYREKLLPEEIVIVDENAISANKLSVHERSEMQKVISLIKQERFIPYMLLIELAYLETLMKHRNFMIYEQNIMFN